MNKLQLFYIYKFESDRLKEYNYNIELTINEARKNGELVSVGDSQVLRIIRKITQSEYTTQEIQNLENMKNELLKKESPEELLNIHHRIDTLLHIPQYISIVINNISDYKHMIKKGLIINGKKFVRLMCGASHARKNTVIFCDEDIEKKLKTILKNGMKNIKIALSKYNAYFALSSSATHVVSSPKICVVPDKVIYKERLVDWVEEHDNGDTVEEKIVELEFNLWDGMGIITPTYAKKWACELGIDDYIPSAFTIRNAFIKGMVCVFPFHDFAKLVAKKHNIINDVWGNQISDVRNYDMILTESQFKLWNAFDSYNQYEQNCINNDLTWGISRVSPKEEKKYSSTNYQFVQAINLNNDSIHSLCQDTIDWFQNILHMDVMQTILFLSGNSLDDIVDEGLLNISKVKNSVVKLLLLNNNLINDPYVKNTVYNFLSRKINESYLGKLLVKSNFQVMISDPYAFCEYLFDMPIKGLLNENEHYSYFWNNEGSKNIVAMRSPLTWRSEVNKLHLKSNSKIKKWYKYLNSGIVYNVHGVDCMLAADSDYDYDIVMTTDSKEFVDGAYGGLPITYQKNKVDKVDFNEDKLYLSDISSFNSQIGKVTNYSTSMYCMLAEYEYTSDKHQELIRRLKICRKEQGSQIDKAKGIIVKPFPSTWVKFQEILSDDTDEEINRKQFENSLLITKKPYFMRWLYPKYNKKYKQYKNNADTYCSIMFCCTFDELLKKQDKTEEEKKYIISYYNDSPLNEADCTMNTLCKYMESVKLNLSNLLTNTYFDYNILMDERYDISEKNELYQKILSLYKEFHQNKHLFKSTQQSMCDDLKDKYDDIDFNNLQEMYRYYQNKLYDICSNIRLATTIAVDICYRKFPKSQKDFVWNICDYGLYLNVYRKQQDKIYIPVKSGKEDFQYLWESYEQREVYLI